MTTTSTTSADKGRLPQLDADTFLADGGLETTLVFLHGIDLPDFAAFPLLDSDDGRAALERYWAPYFEVAATSGLGLQLDTPTWRANPDWGDRLGYDREALADVNRRAVDHLRSLAAAHQAVDTVLNGAIGPRGDGYVVGEAMTADEAASYHALQVRAFAEAGADLVTAVTMTYVEEAIGIVRAATEVGLPVAVAFTVETDGRLPSGTTLSDAIERLDAETGLAAAYVMVNCAHPSHFIDAFRTDAPWLHRIKGIRANASRMSHAELDEAEELDRGNSKELADDYRQLRLLLPDLRLVGGCCGTDHDHLADIAVALSPA